MDRIAAYCAERADKASRMVARPAFVGGIVIAGVLALLELPGGLSVYRVSFILLRFALLIALNYVLFFRAKVVDFAARNTSWWELLLSAAFAVYQGTRLYRSVESVYLSKFAAGIAPSIPQRLYDAVPLPDGLKTTALTAALVLLTLLAAVTLFIVAVCLVRLLKETFREAFHRLDYPDVEQTLPLGKRILLGAAFAAVTATLCFFALHRGQEWGGDFAYYISQAIAIGSGKPESFGIVWGFGAMLTPIYLLFGYDRVDFSSIIYYKIPGVLCLSLLVFFLFLFFSKRFKAGYAAALTAVFGLSWFLISFTNEVMTDIPFMLFSTLAILCLYGMFQAKSLAKEILFAVTAGVMLAVSDLIRVNGIVLVLTLACAHAICFISWLLRKNRFFDGLGERMPVRHIAVHVMPYLIYFLLIQAANGFMFANAAEAGVPEMSLSAGALQVTSILEGNASRHISFAWLLDNARSYRSMLTKYLANLSPFGLLSDQAPFLFVPLVVVGILRSFRKELLSVIYFFGTLAMLCIVEWVAGLRYLFPILPMLVLFFAVGVQSFVATAGTCFKMPKLAQKLLCVGASLLCVGLLVPTVRNVAGNVRNDRMYDTLAFSEDAKDVYRYIMAETEPDSTIVFVKPPVIGLNTGRKATGQLPVADDRPVYLLIPGESPSGNPIDPRKYRFIPGVQQEQDITLTLVYQNPRFDLYQVTR